VALGLLGVLVGAAVGSLTNPAVTLGLIAVVAVPIALWRWPEAALYVTVGAAALFEAMPVGWPDESTGLVPWFWNVTTITQRFLRVGSDPLYVNVFEIFILTAAVSAGTRAIIERRVRLRVGPLFWAISAYLLFVTLGLVHGVWVGGDLKIALWEGRGQYYLAVVYLLAYATLTDERRLRILLWVVVGCALFKGMQGAVRYFIVLGGRVPSRQGLLSHDQAIYQTSFLLLSVLLAYGGYRSRLRAVAWVALPLVLGTLLLNQRRLGVAMVLISGLVTIPLLYAHLRDRRRHLLVSAAVLLVLIPGYLRVGWNRSGALWEPARAIRSQFSPDYRDEQSDAYREVEHYNLIQTIRRGGKQLMTFASLDAPWHHSEWGPWIGMGYGRELGLFTYMPDLEKYDPFIHYRTHDSLLWVWARLGTGGFVLMWFMVAAALALAGQTLRRTRTRLQSVTLLWAIGMIFAFLMVARYDMGMAEYRPLIVLGLMMGVVGALHRQVSEAKEPTAQGATP